MSQYHNRTLNSEAQESLAQWLKEQRIELNVRTRRFFSDVLPLAKIVKLSHPRLVELHNYSPKNSVKLKLENWETFESKVLRRLNITVPHDLLEKLANAETGAIETLFYQLIPVIKGRRGLMPSPMTSPMLPDNPGESPTRSKKSTSLGVLNKSRLPVCRSRTVIRSPSNKVIYPSTVGDLTPAVKILNLDVENMIDGKMQKVPKKLVAYEDYAEVLRASKEKDNYINLMGQKTDYLQSMIAVKEERISDLMEQLAKLSVSILTSRSANLCDNDCNEDDDNRISINTHQTY